MLQTGQAFESSGPIENTKSFVLACIRREEDCGEGNIFVQLDTFASSLQRRAVRRGLQYELRAPKSASDIQSVFDKMELSPPLSTTTFYQFTDGFHVVSPQLQVYALSELTKDGHLLVFATFDRVHHVAFDTSRTNVADEWDIVNVATGFRLTHTLGSFIANKTWAWIDQGRSVWLDEFGTDAE